MSGLNLESTPYAVVDGGLIVFDDYYSYEGRAIAVHEFLGTRKLGYVLEGFTSEGDESETYQALVIRKGRWVSQLLVADVFQRFRTLPQRSLACVCRSKFVVVFDLRTSYGWRPSGRGELKRIRWPAGPAIRSGAEGSHLRRRICHQCASIFAAANLWRHLHIPVHDVEWTDDRIDERRDWCCAPRGADFR